MTEWRNEPDSEDIEAGELYPRYIRRMPEMGHLCGYIAIPPEHPWASMGYDDVPCQVHGGLTYYSQAEEFFDVDVVPRGWHVFGFDCAHAGDLSPFMAERIMSKGHPMAVAYGVYRNIDYVREELANLARQAKDQAGPSICIGEDAIE